MAILSDTQKATLNQVLAANGLDGLDPHSAANLMNAGRTKAINLPRPFTLPQIMAVLAPEHLAGVMGHPLINRLLDAIEANEREKVALFAGTFALAGLIGDGEKDAVLAILAATDDATAPEVSLYDEHFPGFSYEVETTETVKLFNPDGSPQVDEQGVQLYGPAVQKIRYDRCTAAIIEEARG